ncbi:hypothetical protein DFQ28_001156 [Apophysomyces sp. BC1034]|nr:hypothetical protein DFQ30_003756 [Apophysomyces sp. BC1015]KAG0180424.1 hypothetical protein DFQ29_000717 [Apophysomyces sp. BC1021]KAG0190992.1 hypothetical protein DFQ28_001156 [Apophysomyces sp. BC1034]
MAAAYQSLQNWKIDRTTLQELPEPQEVHTQLQSMAHSEATNIFNECDQLSNHKETALGLASRLVIQLYEQQPSSP